ncbi:MAG: AzlC family ABC transporter permease [Burkholderiales bacterium]
MNGRLREFGAGLAAVAPLAAGAVPFGLIYGVVAIQAGIAPLLAIAIASIVFAGSAQFMITQLVAAGSPPFVVVTSVLTINLRHALYSAALARALAPLSRPWKVVLAYLLTDEAYAAAYHRFTDDERSATRHWFLLGCGLGLWLAWQIACVVGVTLGGTIPATWSLDFAATLTFIAIVVPLLVDRAALAAMLAAGITAVALHQLPYKLAIIAAALAGIGAGVALDRSPSGKVPE